MTITPEQLKELPLEDLIAIAAKATWDAKALPHQQEPEGDWSIWLMLAGRGAGKQVALTERVPTTNGWTTIGDLKVGDELFDESGRVCRVVQLHPIDLTPRSYRVTFSDGSTVDACGDHLWTTWTHRARKQRMRHGLPTSGKDWPTFCVDIFDCHGNIKGSVGPETRSTDEIRATLFHGARGDLNHSIPVCLPMELPERQLPLDPWLLGYWLGNGTTRSGDLCAGSYNGDFDGPHVMGRVEAAGFTAAAYEYTEKGQWRIVPNGLCTVLRAMGLIDNKHIPAEYLRASIAQRTELLRGLCDSDGYCGNGKVEFCSTDKALASQVLELARSLGERATMNEGRAVLEGVDYGPKYRVIWTASLSNPFTLPRKVARVVLGGKSQRERCRHRMITSIEPIEPVPMRCITVDSQHGLFLISDAMIPTHNTRASAETLWIWAWFNPGTRWLVSAPTNADLRATCIEGESGLLNVTPHELIQRTPTGGLWNSSEKEIRLVNGSLIKGISAEEPERFRGPQFHGGWLDELCAWNNAQDAWDMIGYTMRLGDHPKILISTTPKPTPLIRDLVKRKDKDVAITTASTYANAANLAKPFLDKLREQEGTRLGRQEIHAEILDAEEGGIIRRKSIRLWPNGKSLPKLDYVCVSFDTAFSEHDWDKRKQTADPTACTIWGVFYHEERKRNCILLLDAWDDHIGFDDLRLKALAEAKSEWGTIQTDYVAGKKVAKGKRPDIIVIEEKGSGISLAQSLEREGVPVQRYDPGRLSKVTRLHMVSHLFANGVVYVPESSKNEGKPANWADTMIEQLCSFAGEGSTQHDDWVDSTSQALLLLINHLQITVTPLEDRAIDDDDGQEAVEEPSGNPYMV